MAMTKSIIEVLAANSSRRRQQYQANRPPRCPQPHGIAIQLLHTG